MSHGCSKPVVTGVDGGLGHDQSRLVMTGFLWFFAVSVWSFGYFLLWLTGHGHGLPKRGPKTVTGPDLKALEVIHLFGYLGYVSQHTTDLTVSMLSTLVILASLACPIGQVADLTFNNTHTGEDHDTRM